MAEVTKEGIIEKDTAVIAEETTGAESSEDKAGTFLLFLCLLLINPEYTDTFNNQLEKFILLLVQKNTLKHLA